MDNAGTKTAGLYLHFGYTALAVQTSEAVATTGQGCGLFQVAAVCLITPVPAIVIYNHITCTSTFDYVKPDLPPSHFHSGRKLQKTL